MIPRPGVAASRLAPRRGRRLLRRVSASGGALIRARGGLRLGSRGRLVGVGLRVRRA